MSKTLLYFASMVVVGFMLALGGVAQAAFETVGVYDPDDDPHHNQVDQSGMYDSHTGKAGPKNVIDLAAFQSLIGLAFDADGGGVVDVESGGLDGQDIIATFGVSGTKSITISSIGGTIHRGTGIASGNRLPTSGNARFSKSDSGDFVFDIGPMTGGAPGEAVTYFAGTVVYADHRDVNPQVTATFSGGGSVTAIADMPSGAPSNSKDTFFGFAAPRGESIVNVTFDLAAYTVLDDVAFITSAFVVVLKEASTPSPANGRTDVPRDVVLSWTPGDFAAPTNGHKVYFGESFNEVNDGIGGVTQSASSYARRQRLDFGTTYYWRVDEVNAPPTSHIEFKGEVWSFTTELLAYPVENILATASSTGQEGTGPENTINGSGLDVNDLHSTEATDMWLSGDEPNGSWIEYDLDKVYKLHEMWVWNSNQLMESFVGFGLKDVTIEYSTNDTDYTTLGTTHEFVRAPGEVDYAHNTTVDFGGAAAKYVRLTISSNWGGILEQYCLSEVRFFSIPVQAREPSPDSGTTEVAVDVSLGFKAGREAAKHNVYLSSDEQAVIDGNAPVSIVTEASHVPLSLDLGETYYWKINEVNEAEAPTTWEGEIWNFTTIDHLVLDDFEDYNDWPPNEIWSTWVDGYGVPINGGTVGYPNPDWNQDEHYVETTNVHGDEQSMPFFYSNTGAAAYSEGERTFAVPQDWTKAGVQTLALYFYGTAGNTGQLYVKVNGSKVVYDGDAVNLTRAGWQACNIELASFNTNLQSVMTLAIGIDGNGASGTLYFDDIRLYSRSPEFITPVEPNNAGLIGHWKFDEGAGTIAFDSSGLGNDGTLGGNPQWVAGVKDGALDLDGVDDYVAIDGIADEITTNIFTVSAWIKTTQTGDGDVIGSNSGSGHDFIFGVDQGFLLVEADSVNLYPPAINDDQWHSIAYARDGSTAYAYVDGVLRGTETATGNPAGQTRWSIGQEWDSDDSSDPSDEYEGMVDDVRFYNYALSYDEVAWLAGWTLPFDKPF